MALKFMTDPAGAQGGQISLALESVLGACGVNVATQVGDSAMAIADRVAMAITAPEAPSPDCPLRRHGGDAMAVDHMVNLVSASSLRICNTDPGVGFQMISEETDNLNPIAVITPAAVATEVHQP